MYQIRGNTFADMAFTIARELHLRRQTDRGFGMLAKRQVAACMPDEHRLQGTAASHLYFPHLQGPTEEGFQQELDNSLSEVIRFFNVKEAELISKCQALQLELYSLEKIPNSIPPGQSRDVHSGATTPTGAATPTGSYLGTGTLQNLLGAGARLGLTTPRISGSGLRVAAMMGSEGMGMSPSVMNLAEMASHKASQHAARCQLLTMSAISSFKHTTG